jgi:DNA repair protein RadA/Sms
VEEVSPAVLVVDSVQALFSERLASAPGSVGQMRSVTAELGAWAKRWDIAVLMVGHVTKEGVIAGPKVVEHMVDAVLYIEGERNYTLRVLRSVKNRYGPTNEIGVFEMGREGLTEVCNPSEMLLMERPARSSGTVVVPTVEGTRPVLVEIQALVTPSNLTVPRRMATGVDYNRMVLLIAILERRLGLRLQASDVFVNVAGGIKVDEPAVDVGIVAAIVSSFRDKPVDELTTVMGEVGLTGEVRAVPQVGLRLKEARKLGFARSVIPNGNRTEEISVEGLEVVTVRSVKDAIQALL